MWKWKEKNLDVEEMIMCVMIAILSNLHRGEWKSRNGGFPG